MAGGWVSWLNVVLRVEATTSAASLIYCIETPLSTADTTPRVRAVCPRDSHGPASRPILPLAYIIHPDNRLLQYCTSYWLSQFTYTSPSGGRTIFAHVPPLRPPPIRLPCVNACNVCTLRLIVVVDTMSCSFTTLLQFSKYNWHIEMVWLQRTYAFINTHGHTRGLDEFGIWYTLHQVYNY